MKIGALVPARLNSLRLPRKNILPLAGKPLVNWTIDVLLESDCFADITLSTESEEIADVVRSHYPESAVKILFRPEGLARHDSPMREVIRHYLQNRPAIDWLGIFLPTFPFRKAAQIRKASNAIHTLAPIRVTSVTREETFSRDFYYESKEGFRHFFRDHGIFCRHSSGCYTFHHRDFTDGEWSRYNLTMNERNYRLQVDARENTDVDTQEDFELSKRLTSVREIEPRPLVLHETGPWFVSLPKGVPLEDFLAFIGPARLADPGQPLLILEKAPQPVFQFRFYESSPMRKYLACQTAERLMRPSELVVKTQNMQLLPTTYRQNESYRLTAKAPNGATQIEPVSKEAMLHIPATDTEEAIAHDRVIFMEELRKQQFYLDPFLLT